MSRDRMKYMLDPVLFARECVNFYPDELQARVLGGARRGILCCSRQWGKSTITALAAVYRAWMFEESLVLVMSPSGRQSSEFVRKAAMFLRKLGVRVRGDGDNEISLLFPNGSRIIGLPGREATIRGFSAVSLLLVDEAARVPDELYQAVRPMLAVGDGDLWLMSTPYGKRGFFHEEWSRGGDKWLRVMAPATECQRISTEFLAEEREKLGERMFRQEYLCEFVQSDESFFNEEEILRCVREDIPPLFR